MQLIWWASLMQPSRILSFYTYSMATIMDASFGPYTQPVGAHEAIPSVV